MASNNQLLGSGRGFVETVEEGPPQELRAPAWRYHESLPKGKVVYTDAELDRLDALGWVDHPGKIGTELNLEPEVEPEVEMEKTEVKTINTKRKKK